MWVENLDGIIHTVALLSFLFFLFSQLSRLELVFLTVCFSQVYQRKALAKSKNKGFNIQRNCRNIMSRRTSETRVPWKLDRNTEIEWGKRGNYFFFSNTLDFLYLKARHCFRIMFDKVIYQTWETVFDHISRNTEKIAENTTRSGVVFTCFEVRGDVVKQCLECLMYLLNGN